MVPEGWLNLKLGKVAEFQRGFDLPKSKRVDGVTPIISSAGLSGFHNESKVAPPGVVTGRYGSIGQVFFIEEDFWPLNTSLWVKDFHGNDPKFIYYLLSKFDFKKFSDKTGVPGVNRNDLHAIKVFVPPFAEQKKIAQILATWDKAITTTEQLLANSQQQKKALMQQLLTGKKRLLDENGERFSDSWYTTTLNELGVTFSGLSGKKKEDFGKGKKFITYVNIFKNSQIDLDEIGLVIITENESQTKVEYGDIFFTTSSETIKEVGMSSVLLEQPDELYLNSFCFGFRLHNFKTLYPEYARYILRSYEIRTKIAKLGQGATRYNLPKKQLMKVELHLPSIKEQKRVVEILSCTDLEIDSLKIKLDIFKREKKSLMEQLLTGKRRVKIEGVVA